MIQKPITSAAISRQRLNQSEDDVGIQDIPSVCKHSDRLFIYILGACLSMCVGMGVCVSLVAAQEQSTRVLRREVLKFNGHAFVSEVPDPSVFNARLQERYFNACAKMAAQCPESEMFAMLKRGYCLGRSEFYGTASFPSASTQLDSYFQAPVDGARDGMRGCSKIP